jgi:gliding motility-associated-like protein
MFSNYCKILSRLHYFHGLKPTERGNIFCSRFYSPLRQLFFAGLLLIISQYIDAQVINNNGAVVNVTTGIYVTSKDAENNSGGTLLNNGNLNLTGSYTNNANTSGNGSYRIAGNWTNTSVFLCGNSTVLFNGSDDQTVTESGVQTFFNLYLQNSGAAALKYLILASNLTVNGTLTMELGNIYTGSNLLYLYNQAAASLNYTSTTGSRILGKFERGINQTATYLFPLGTSTYYNPANLKINSISSSGSVLSQFFAAVPGNNGLPIPDPPVEIADAFSGGYWRMTPNSFSASNFNINLDAAGFADTVRDATRLIKRTSGANWIVDGTHQDAVGTIVYRNNLTGDFDPAGTDFALGRARPLITVAPVSLVQCEHTNAIFSVTATGSTPFKYQWYFNGNPISNGPDYSGARTATLTVIDINLSDAGSYYCIVTDKYRNSTTSPSATLTVMKNPVTSITNKIQQHACSNLSFTNIILGFSYWDPGSYFTMTLDKPSGVTTSTVPSSATYYNIGDIISGSFDNLSDAPLTVRFIITPIGPTGCIGKADTALVTVNPHPKATPLNNLPAICDSTLTDVVMKTSTKMTQGTIDFDYKITRTDGSVVGNSASAFNVPQNTHLQYRYTNSSDTLKSVFYRIMPKNSASGCLPGDSVITEVKICPYPLNHVTITQYNKCQGGNEAAMVATLNKGASPYWVKWIGPVSQEGYGMVSFTGLRSGMYEIEVRDNLGCTTFRSDIKKIPDGAVLDPNISPIIKPSPSPGYNTSCWYGNDGEMRIWMGSAGTTGVPPFSYQLIRNGTQVVASSSFPNKGVVDTVKNLAPGEYTLVTADANGCSNSASNEIIAPDTLKILLTPKVYQGGFNVTCAGSNDGSIKAAVSGGNGSYTYKWTTADGYFTCPDNTDSLTNLIAGTYTLTITDAMFCTRSESITLHEPDGMKLQPATVLSHTPDMAYNISCAGGNNGSIDISISGGTAPYTYFWTDSASFTSNSEDLHNLSAGKYTVVVTDGNHCVLKLLPLSVYPSYTLTEPPPLNISAVVSNSTAGGYNINCNGDNNGSVNTTVTGGSGTGYIYTWSSTDGSGIVAGAEDQGALKAGTYHLDVTDLYGCQAYADYPLSEPPKLTLTLTAKNITCASAMFDNGSIDLAVTGGVAPYTYLWSNGATVQNISGLTQGNYSVTVTDANGCSAGANAVISLPPPVQYNKILSNHYNNGFNISCSGKSDGSIKIVPTSGTKPYIFTWSNGATTSEITGLKAGSYTLTITDSLLCTATETIVLSEPDPIGLMADLSTAGGGYNINCAGGESGTIDITPVNAVGNVSYFWSDGSSSRNRTGLKAGDYTVIITDGNYCHTDSTLHLSEPDSMKISLSVSEPWCPDKPDGAIGAIVTGGVVSTDYTYKWSDNSTTSTISNILPGIYSVTATDMNNCVISKSVELKPQRETCLVIPNAISPNGDLINDEWNIGNIDLYPEVEIIIFNRWGETLWKSARGYPDKWNGTSKGQSLPIDSYHYIIDLHNGSKPIVGNVTIVR